MPQPADDAIRRGRLFLHARHVTEHINPDTGKRDPVLCKVTKATLTDVYYRSDINPDGTGGSKWRTERDKFLTETLLSWVV